MKFGKEIHIQGNRIHVKPLTGKFITTGVSRVCEFMFEFGSLALNSALLLGYGAILNIVEGFYLRSHFEYFIVVYLWLSAVAVVSGYC